MVNFGNMVGFNPLKKVEGENKVREMSTANG